MSAIDAHDVSSLRASARLELAGELGDDVEAAGLGGSGECYGERGPDGVEPLVPSSGGSCDAKTSGGLESSCAAARRPQRSCAEESPCKN
jgi:hypothetical protein